MEFDTTTLLVGVGVALAETEPLGEALGDALTLAVVPEPHAVSSRAAAVVARTRECRWSTTLTLP
jgi:hypothetical protein